MGQRDYSRAQRVGDSIHREIAGLILHAVSDPRVGGVTVSGVDMSPDLRQARVLVTPRQGCDADAAVAALNHAARFLRGRLGATLRLRTVPRLVFAYDATLDRAGHLEELIGVGLPAVDDADVGGRGD